MVPSFLLKVFTIIVSGLQRHIRRKNNPAIDVFNDDEFAEFKCCLDSEMKRLQRIGMGSRRRKAEPLTEAEEKMLRQRVCLVTALYRVL